MAAGVINTFIFTGEERDERGYYIIPRFATHLIFHESITEIPVELFYYHLNIVEVYCHAGVKRIERFAFYGCPRLRRVIIPGVEVVVDGAFWCCEAVTYIECPKLERIGYCAFNHCESLRNLNVPSVTIIEGNALMGCEAMTDAQFGKDLESFGRGAFLGCRSLERLTIPLKNGFIADDNIFQGCDNLRRVDLVEGAALRDTIATLQLEEWRNDMTEEIDSINHILPHTPAGSSMTMNDNDGGGKAIAIREWIPRVLRKIIHYKTQHRQLLSGTVATTLEHAALPNDIVMRNVLPFLELPSHRFEGEEEVEG